MGFEERHQALQKQIHHQVKSLAHETALPKIMEKTYYKEKETFKSINLSRMLHWNKGLMGISHQNLTKESAICRNRIVLEHVLASRNMRGWRD